MRVLEEKQVLLDLLVENSQSLRPVNPKSEEFIGLVASIKESGFQSQITVREKKLEDGSLAYEIIDGLHRSTAAKHAGLTEISAKVLECTDEEMLKLQMQMNWHVIPTSHKQFQSHIELIMGYRPSITRSELASELGISTTKLDNLIRLKNITDAKILQLIADGTISLMNAYALALLDHDDQINMLDSAIKEKADLFVPKVKQRVKEVREARQKGKEKTEITFVAIPQLRKLREIQEIIENEEALTTFIGLVNPKTIKEAFTLGLSYSIKLDPLSIKSQKDEFESKERAKEEKRVAKRNELEAKKIIKKEEELKALRERAIDTAIEVEVSNQ